MTAKNIKILIADDNELLRSLLAEHFEKKSTEIFSAADGLEALEMCREIHPDVILMDLDMPIMDGYETIRQIREENETVKIIILSANDIDSNEKNIIAAVNGYLKKVFSIHKIEEAINVVMAGEKYFVNIPIQDEKKQIPDDLSDLTEREQKIVQFVATENLTNEQIANKIGVSERTVKNDLTKIYRMLGLQGRIQLIKKFFQKDSE